MAFTRSTRYKGPLSSSAPVCWPSSLSSWSWRPLCFSFFQEFAANRWDQSGVYLYSLEALTLSNPFQNLTYLYSVGIPLIVYPQFILAVLLDVPNNSQSLHRSCDCRWVRIPLFDFFLLQSRQVTFFSCEWWLDLSPYCSEPHLCVWVPPYAALNFTADWAQGSLRANSTYKSFSNAVVNAEVGLHVGLYGINITLRGESDSSDIS